MKTFGCMKFLQASIVSGVSSQLHSSSRPLLSFFTFLDIGSFLSIKVTGLCQFTIFSFIYSIGKKCQWILVLLNPDGKTIWIIYRSRKIPELSIWCFSGTILPRVTVRRPFTNSTDLTSVHNYIVTVIHDGP